MQPGKSPRRAWLASIVAAAAIGALASALSPTGALAPASALAALAPPSDGALSPRLAELAKPALRTAPAAEQAQALSLANEGPGSLVRDGNRVLVEVRFDHGAAVSVGDLRQAGAQVVNVSPQYQTVTVAAKPDELRALNGVPRVAGAREVLKPITHSTCPSGEVVSEGVQQLHAGDATGEARQVFGVNGSGVTVGILSDSYNRATEAADGSGPVATTASRDVGNGDLPGLGNTCAGETTPVGVLDDSEAEGEDEGRAMSQIVHDVAPGANLAFATAFTGEAAFAENIEHLAKPVSQGGAGADVVVDDVAYFDEPFFQDGPIGVAAENVVNGGAPLFSSAGNDNLIDESDKDIASWEAPAFRDSLTCPLLLVAVPEFGASHCMDFDPSEGTSDNTFGIRVEEGETLTVDLQWSEPWFGVETDLDAFLLNAAGEPLEEEVEGEEFLVGSQMDNLSTQEPFEFFQWENPGPEREVQLVINRCSGACNPAASATNSPRLKFDLLQNGGGVSETEYPESANGDIVGPTVFGHTGSPSAISVGAVPVPPFFSEEPEPYSSRGPVTYYYQPVRSSSPAKALGSPEVISKPDLAAPDCGVTTFFAFQVSGKWRFCGTSAAAPHAAGIAALMLQRDPHAIPSQVRSALVNSAKPVGSFGPDAVGAGLANAVGALELTPDANQTGGESSTFFVPPKATPSPPSQPKPAPTTFFRKRPPRLILTRRHSVKWAFRFGSDQGGVTFLCKVDRGRFHRCDGRFVRRYRLGRHVLRVKARRNSDGATDATPAVYRFRVKRVRRGLIKRRHARHRHRG